MNELAEWVFKTLQKEIKELKDEIKKLKEYLDSYKNPIPYDGGTVDVTWDPNDWKITNGIWSKTIGV